MAALKFSISELIHAVSNIQPLLWTCFDCGVHLRFYKFVRTYPEFRHEKRDWCNEGALDMPTKLMVDAAYLETQYVGDMTS